MAKKLKDHYNKKSTIFIADKISSTYPAFCKTEFVKFVSPKLSSKEFFERQDVFVLAFEKYLFPEYEKNLAIFTKILGEELQTTEGMFIYGWWLWPVSRYVEKHGVENFDESMKFIYELTKRFTGEFAVRPLIVLKPARAFKIMEKWSRDKNVHVRRLSSEGVRIKLPWAKKMMTALDHFETYEKILTNLKNDSAKFVQKSVGNNLNDLMKIDTPKALSIIKKWQKANPSPETLWIIKHGLRSQRKKTKI